MTAVLTALGTMAVIAFAGWVLATFRVLGPGAQQVLARLVFALATPSLLITTIGEANLSLLLTRTAATTVISTLVVATTAAAIFGGLLRRGRGQATVATLAASYVNAGNIGIPVAIYVLTDALAVVPTMLMQLLVLAPTAYAVLDTAGAGRRELVLRPLRSPLTIGALIGLALAIVPWTPPDAVLQPLRLVGSTAAPLALLTLGMSFAPLRRSDAPSTASASKPAPPPGHWLDVAIVATLRGAVHPALTFAVAHALGVAEEDMLAVVLMAALPTAQNVLVYALQFDRGLRIARDSQVITTAVSIPLLVGVVALLH
ncbi:AEC family transporter [Ruania halotolerans]|uniref:AEC family transporter n=1 Tax=Ruania halotolerans TaxID=2897773 RepID=UPI001E298044|nr:AEC family transporter [Ruania halotolerans]UFU05851.1 AEC family transporter [Ruania halotolerans]